MGQDRVDGAAIVDLVAKGQTKAASPLQVPPKHRRIAGIVETVGGQAGLLMAAETGAGAGHRQPVWGPAAAERQDTHLPLDHLALGL